jgi:hypothetical protein
VVIADKADKTSSIGFVAEGAKYRGDVLLLWWVVENGRRFELARPSLLTVFQTKLANLCNKPSIRMICLSIPLGLGLLGPPPSYSSFTL